jgi:hypothetical protein
MKYLKKYKLYESYINPISDYLTDFIDEYDFEINTPEMGVCDLTLKSDQYDAQQILSLYQELISRLEDDYELKGGAHTYISFYKEMVHIRIERVVKDLSKEFKFETKEQEIAYNAVLKVISPDKLRLDYIRPDGWMTFSKIDADDEDGFSEWICITKHGQIILPILRGRKSQRQTELSFNDSDINWFKKLIELDKDYYRYGFLSANRSTEYRWMGNATQEELREKYR